MVKWYSGYLESYGRLVRDRERARLKAGQVFALAARDPTYWAGGNGRLNKGVLLAGLGFPEGMSTATVAQYWTMLVQSKVIDPIWGYKLAVIFKFLLHLDAETWLEENCPSQERAAYERAADKLNSRLEKEKSPLRVTHQAVRSLHVALRGGKRNVA